MSETAETPDVRARRKSLRIHGAIMRDLGIRIVSGCYRPGDVLDDDVTASDRLLVSHRAYRKALRALAAKGLVASRAKGGACVLPRQSWHLFDPDVLSWMFEFEPEGDWLARLFELRRMVEPEAAALAAERRTEAQLHQMAEALKEMTGHSLATVEGHIASQNFHSALLAASCNPFLVSLTSGVRAAVAWTTTSARYNSRPRRDPIPDHEQVYDAVAAGDAGAAHRATTNLLDMALLDASRSHARL